jgi:hypothetical protein
MNQVVQLSDRDKVNLIESEMRKHPQVSLSLKHYNAPGVYARELFVPAGILLTGKIHKFAQINILSKGTMRVLTEDGIKEVSASFTVVSPPGTKRIALAVTDCVWTTFLPTDETDPEKIEIEFTAENEDEYQLFLKQEQQKCLS